jgi:tetratricopeptide (TPR) repeat protein
MGNDLGVSALVSGRVVPRGDTIEVSAELTDVRDNTVIWGQHYSIKSSEIISLQQRMAGDIADKLRSKLSLAEKQQVTRQGTQNPDAYDLYLKGRYAWNKRTRPDLETAISYLNEAIAKDPSYALAYSGLADAYSVLPNYAASPSENFPKSNAAARKALELDPTLAHPHAVLGVNETQYDWDFAGGEAEFKKALELDPSDASAHQWYAESLDRIGGRQQEALAEINRARQLDPQSPVITRELGGILTTAGQYDQAIAICQKLVADDPTFEIAHDCLAKAYWAKHMYPQVVEEFKIEGRLSGIPEEVGFADALDQGFRSAGWKGALTKAIAYREAQRIKTGDYFSPEEIAVMYADLGDKDQAFRWLNIAYQEHDWLLIGLKTFIPFAPLRSDPRFAELAHKIGLPD